MFHSLLHVIRLSLVEPWAAEDTQNIGFVSVLFIFSIILLGPGIIKIDRIVQSSQRYILFEISCLLREVLSAWEFSHLLIRKTFKNFLLLAMLTFVFCQANLFSINWNPLAMNLDFKHWMCHIACIRRRWNLYKITTEASETIAQNLWLDAAPSCRGCSWCSHCQVSMPFLLQAVSTLVSQYIYMLILLSLLMNVRCISQPELL